MTIGIYKLVFKDSSFYIGKSIDIERRYAAHLYTLKNNTSSIKLQKAFQINGNPDLEIVVECTEEELDSNEIEAIEIYDATNKGLNSGKGGISTANRNGLNCYLVSEDKSVYTQILRKLLTDTTCKTIAEELGVSIDIVLQISSMKSHSWLAEEMPEEYKVLELINKVGRINYFLKPLDLTLVSPEGMEIRVTNIKEFCSTYEIPYNSIYSVVKGYRNSWKGWRLLNTILKKYPTLISPEGVEFHVPYGKAKEFSLINKLNPSSLTRLLSGKASHYKHWTIKHEIH